jgi:hypothetical protein
MLENLTKDEIIQKRKIQTEIKYHKLYLKKSPDIQESFIITKNNEIDLNCITEKKTLKKRFFDFLIYFIFFIALFIVIFLFSEYYIQNKNCILNKTLYGSREKCMFHFFFENNLF